MVKPPGSQVSEFVAFAIVDELLRTLPIDPAALLRRVITRVEAESTGPKAQALRVINAMLDEYPK
jgi:hypothetical protein